MSIEWNGTERRQTERRNYCNYPRCGSALEIKSAHDELKVILEDIRQGQRDILGVSKDIASMQTAISTMESDVEDIKKKLDEKVGKKDLITMGSIIGGIFIVLEFLYWAHEHLK